MKSSDNRMIRLVAAFKLVKAATLIITGIGILKLLHMDVGTELDHWIARLGFDPGSRLVSQVIEKATRLTPGKIRDMGLVSFVYAALFLTEGIGLWMLKRWAEWFTIIVTGSLLPFEAYELWRHPTVVKVVVLAINVAVVAYLIYRIRSERGERLHG
jgi:uncharacterized membrane protein (DUF2068 family)